jgi:ABC-2 type transport system ATP-binding protein
MKGEGEEGVIMGEYVIETQGLTKRYTRRKEAVKSLDLQVPKGSVYVFLGRNGAGKTTTIRILMGLLQKTSGKAEVLGMDLDKQPVPIKKLVGYVADNQKMYDWMTVEETINFCSSFYPSWNDTLAEDLLNRFELFRKAKTVFFSTHIITEAEQIADYVGILEGREET